MGEIAASPEMHYPQHLLLRQFRTRGYLEPQEEVLIGRKRDDCLGSVNQAMQDLMGCDGTQYIEAYQFNRSPERATHTMLGCHGELPPCPSLQPSKLRDPLP
jgi:hypothetical protein